MTNKSYWRPWLFGVVVTLIAGLAGAQEFQEGKHYRRLKNPQQVETGKKIEVIEFFSFGCPHCASFEPFVGPWSRKLPADVQFRRVPVLFQSAWINLAKIHFTLETLGVADQHAQAVFNAIHKDRLAMHQEAPFLDFASKLGLDRQKVSAVYNSFSVGSSVNRARAIAAAYAVQGVPLIVVDGKYVAEVDSAGGFEALLRLTEHLITKSKQERGKG